MIINLRHLMGAIRYSLAGLRRGWQAEQAFRHEVLLLPVMILVLCLVRPGALWSAGLLAGWLFVMALELLNSAIEEAFDLVSPDYNIHAKHGKDLASAAIFIAVCANAGLWVWMLAERYLL